MIGIAEVLDASTAPSLQIASSARKTSALTSIFSNTASTTRSAVAAASRSVVVVIRASAASASASAIRPFVDELRRTTSRIDAEAALERLGRDVAQDHLVAARGGHLGDAPRP